MKDPYETLTQRLEKLDAMRAQVTPDALQRVSVANRLPGEDPTARINATQSIQNTSAAFELSILDRLQKQLENKSAKEDLTTKDLLGMKMDAATKGLELYQKEDGTYDVRTPQENDQTTEEVANYIKSGILTPESPVFKNLDAKKQLAVLKKLDEKGYRSDEQKKADEVKNQALGIAQELASRKLGPVTGGIQLEPLIPGSNAQTTINKIDQLKSILALDKRALLKGSGQISDKEQEMLTKSVTALGRNQSETDFKKELQNIQDILNGKYKEKTDVKNDVNQNDDPLGILK